jgi:hypothetical protein
MGKIQKATRLPKDQADRVERYADQHDISEADALRRLIRVGLEEEEQLATDGGWTVKQHPWTEPLIEIGESMARYAVLAMLAGIFAVGIPGGAIRWFGIEPAPETTALFLSLFVQLALVGFGFLLVALVCIGALEYLMHPMDAPIRRYFPSTWPDHGADADQEEVSA